MAEYDLRTKEYLTVLEQELKSLENQKSIADEYGGWPQKFEDKLQKVTQQIDDIYSGKDPMIIGKPDEGGITDIETEGEGWGWLERIKNLFSEKDDDDESVDWGTYENDEKWGDLPYGDTPGGGGGESLAGKDTDELVVYLVKNYGINKGIQLATSQFGIPFQVASIALKSPIGQGAVQDFSRMASNLNPFSSRTVPDFERQQQKEKLKKEVWDKLVRQGGAESMKQAGVTLSGSGTVTPKIETTAPGQAGGYQHPGGQGQNRERQREERAEQVQREVARYKDTATTGAKAGFRYGLQDGGLVGIDYLTRRL